MVNLVGVWMRDYDLGHMGIERLRGCGVEGLRGLGSRRQC